MGPRYRSLSGSWVDPEKQRLQADMDSDDEAPTLVSSSRDASNSFDPILGKPTSHSFRNSLPSFAYHMPRRRFTRYFTCFIATSLLIFIFLLVNASWASRAEVSLGIKDPPANPAPWEQFPFLKRYHGGIRTLVSRDANQPEYPVDEDEEAKRLEAAAEQRKEKDDAALAGEKGFGKRDESWKDMSARFNPFDKKQDDAHEKKVECYLDQKTKLQVPQVLGYKGVPQGFPNPAMGSAELLGLKDDMCFERYGRLGPYGFGYSRKFGGSGAGMEGDTDGSQKIWGDQLEIDYRNVHWAEAQEACMESNKDRFKPAPKGRNDFFKSMGVGGPKKEKEEEKVDEKTKNGKEYTPRTAVIIRTWHDYQYDPEDIFYLRALVNELSIQSGSEYVVHFLIHVKDDNLQVWSDEDTYQRTLDNALPEEFRGMGTLWSERQMGLIYGGVHDSMYRDLPVHGAYRSTYMPVQYFAHNHPEYDFFWHWEMDIRYTGHFYHLFNQVSQWAKQQPRKGLWERNGRFYVPAVHGTWDNFKQMVHFQTEQGTSGKHNVYNKHSDASAKDPLDKAGLRSEKPVWGPDPPTGEGDSIENEHDPIPPTSYDKDEYEWGVGEEADFITFNPLFDPSGTNWILAEDVTGYNTTEKYPPRRTAIITASRLSRRLLETMHRETSLKRHTMFSEMWPGSCALHHGLKAVYAPHPVYIDRAWPTSYLQAIFNNGRNGAAGGARTSVFSDERQHNFLGTTWYYHAGFSPNVWKRWLGYKVDNDGGEEYELAGEGRMCLPPMLLHPVKQVDLVFEHQAGEA
ncbi:hypothetical protein Q7P37_009013 [Cladosporium fusiforme]